MVKAVFLDFYGTVVHEDGEIALEYHGLKPAGVFTSEDARAYKPRKEVFQLALRATGLKGNEVVHIGDSLNSDVKGACAAGINAIWVNRLCRPVPAGVTAIGNLLETYSTHYFVAHH